jgi:hypothetical protein
MKSILRLVIGAVIGIGLLLVGVNELGSDEVTCGSQQMSPGDICSEIGGGSTTDRTYDEQKSDNERTGWIMTGIGAVFLIGTVGVAGVGFARRNRVPGPAPAGQ